MKTSALLMVVGLGTVACESSTTIDDPPAGDSTPTPHSFEVTIENTTTESLFVSGRRPFGLARDGQLLQISSSCSCHVCGTGDECVSGDPQPVAVEIPAGDSLTMETSLYWYTNQAVTAESCPEAMDGAGAQCDVSNAFEDGSYQLNVPWDDLTAITEQGLEDSGNEQWGQPLWTAYHFGSAQLSHNAQQDLQLGGDTSTVTIAISP